MAIAELGGTFGAHGADLASPQLTFSSGGRVPLNIAAAQVAATLRRRIIAPGMLAGLARVADFAGLAIASAAVLWLYVAPRETIGVGYLVSSLLLPAAAVILIGSFKGYATADYRKAISAIRSCAGFWTLVFGCFTLILFFLKMGEDFSRVWLATWFLAGLVVLVSLRLFFSRLVASWRAVGLLERRAVLVGGGPEAVAAHPRAARRARQRHPHLRHFRRSRECPRARHQRGPSEARPRRRAA